MVELVGVEVTLLAEAMGALGTNQARHLTDDHLETGTTIGDTEVFAIAL